MRASLNPADRGDGFNSTADLVSTGTIDLYARMQDGQRFGPQADVLVFAAEAGGMARLRSFRTYRARRRGIAPGDIVYDYDAAHLLHSFISRARHPTFYDAFDRDELADLTGQLVVHWPAPMMRNIRKALDFTASLGTETPV